jgi:hypothetical protein
MKNKSPKLYIDNRSKVYGETLTGNRIIRVNARMSKRRPFTKKSKIGYHGLADTIYHERYHLEHPKAHERTVRRITKKVMESMSSKSKKKVIRAYLKKAKPITKKVRNKFYKSEKSSK